MPRIIAGRLKGLRLAAPPGDFARPTADQVKEAIFSILDSLAFEFQGARVLDLFAGSGSLGLEALSRGAAWALLADRQSQALKTIARNVAAARLEDSVQLRQAQWPRAFESLTMAGPFDLILLDPPYAETQLPASLLNQAARLGLARPGALAVWEQEASVCSNLDENICLPWLCLRRRLWGRRGAAFFRLPPQELRP